MEGLSITRGRPPSNLIERDRIQATIGNVRFDCKLVVGVGRRCARLDFEPNKTTQLGS